MYEKTVKHYCTGCKMVHKNGYMLWWQHMDQSMGHKQSNTDLENPDATEQYLCFGRYLKRGWENITPRGFEDATTWEEVKARARELGIDVDEELEQDEHVSEQSSRRLIPHPSTRPEPCLAVQTRMITPIHLVGSNIRQYHHLETYMDQQTSLKLEQPPALEVCSKNINTLMQQFHDSLTNHSPYN